MDQFGNPGIIFGSTGHSVQVFYHIDTWNAADKQRLRDGMEKRRDREGEGRELIEIDRKSGRQRQKESDVKKKGVVQRIERQRERERERERERGRGRKRKIHRDTYRDKYRET